MHYRRLACLLLGAWLAGSLFMTMVATQNFRSVDRLLAHPAPEAAKQIKAIGPEAARAFLRYEVSEQNRWYFQTWEFLQLLLGALLLLILLFRSGEAAFALMLASSMLALVLIARFLLTPEIVALGRLIDFVPADTPSVERSRFWMLHGAYSGMEVLKWILGLMLAGKLLLRGRKKSGEAGGKVDTVDKADHRHVNG